MDVLDKLEKMRSNPQEIRFSDALRIAKHYFGKPRIRGSHHFFSTPWQGDPLVNLQRVGGKAKAYQIRQLLAAIDRLGKESR